MRTIVKWKVDNAITHLDGILDLIEKGESGIKPTTIKWLAGEIRMTIEILGGKEDE